MLSLIYAAPREVGGSPLTDARAHRIAAAAKPANQVSYAEGNGGGRVWALLNGGAKVVLSPGGAFANSFHGIRRRLLHLSVDILRGPFNLFCLALKLTSLSIT